jgi:hypothetical protein
MEKLFLPVIAAADYQAFRGFMKDEIPATFDAWLRRHHECVSYWRAERCVVDVELNPDEFRRFCLSEAMGYDANALCVFADRVGKAKRHRPSG